MKYGISIILPIFLFVALFGFALMCEHTLSSMHSAGATNAGVSCFLNIGECAQSGVDMAIMHISAYQSFFTTQVASLFYFFATLILLVIATYQHEKQDGVLPRLACVTVEEESLHKLKKKKFLKWISLFENSPTFR